MLERRPPQPINQLQQRMSKSNWRGPNHNLASYFFEALHDIFKACIILFLLNAHRICEIIQLPPKLKVLQVPLMSLHFPLFSLHLPISSQCHPNFIQLSSNFYCFHSTYCSISSKFLQNFIPVSSKFHFYFIPISSKYQINVTPIPSTYH